MQNLIVRPVTPAATSFAAIVEECFPLAALTDEHAFWDTDGDVAVLAGRRQRMSDSCARFIGAEGCDAIPTSQFDVRCVFSRA